MTTFRMRLALLAAVILAVITLSAPLAGASSVTGPGIPPGAVGPFQIKNHANGRCLDYPPGSDRVRIYDCDGPTATHQLWYLFRNHGGYWVINDYDNRCLAGWAKGPNGWSTWESDCNFDNEDQYWNVWEADHSTLGPINNLYNKALEPDRTTNGDNGTRVEIWDAQGSANQFWDLNYTPPKTG